MRCEPYNLRAANLTFIAVVALGCGYDVLEFDKAASGDDVFRQLVLARILEPTSKAV